MGCSATAVAGGVPITLCSAPNFQSRGLARPHEDATTTFRHVLRLRCARSLAGDLRVVVWPGSPTAAWFAVIRAVVHQAIAAQEDRPMRNDRLCIAGADGQGQGAARASSRNP